MKGVKEYRIDWPGVKLCLVAEYARHIELRRLCVEEAAQGKGIGSAVVRELQRKGKKIVLFPVPSDPDRWADLERFYRALGFVPDFFDDSQFVWKP